MLAIGMLLVAVVVMSCCAECSVTANGERHYTVISRNCRFAASGSERLRSWLRKMFKLLRGPEKGRRMP